MHLTLDTAAALQLARLHQSDVRAAFPRSRRRPLWQRSRRPESSLVPPRRLRLPAAPVFHRTSAPT